MKTIGLIGGMSWESSAVYYQIINRRTREFLGGLASAKILLYSVDFGAIAKMQHERNWVGLEKIMIAAAKKLEHGGADFIVICTNTMHILARHIQRSVGIPILHIGDATGAAIREAGIKRVGLLGTRFTMEKDFLKEHLLDKFGIQAIIPDKKERETIHSIIYDELVNGEFKDLSRRKYEEIIENLAAKGAEGIVLGCTEIPLLLSNHTSDIALFDTTKIHAESAVFEALK